MTAIRTLICRWLDGRIGALPMVAEYVRDPAGDPTQFAHVSVTDNGHRTIDTESGATHYALDLSVEGYVEGSSGPEVSDELNELHAAVITAIMDPGNPPIDGLAETIVEGDLTRSTAFLAEASRMGFRQEMTITFSTRRGNPAAQ